MSKFFCPQRRFLVLMLSLLIIVLLPYAGGYIYFSLNPPPSSQAMPQGIPGQEIASGIDPVYNSPYPKNFFDFPVLTDTTTFIQKMRHGQEDFNPIIFGSLLLFFFAVLGFYLFFPKPPKLAMGQNQTNKLPWWFYLGVIAFAIPLITLLSHTPNFPLIRHWADIPLFWGLTLLLDGWVFHRTNGKSIIGQNPRLLVGIGLASIPGWMIFEYLNFFIADNWYYPHGDLISKGRFVFYALLGSSGLMTMAFEMYSLLQSFHLLANRYSKGPQFALPEWLINLLLILCILSLFFAPFAPLQLFFMLWVSPLLIFLIVLGKLKIWTPATAIRMHGNWSYAMLFALAFYIQGVIHEGINYLSGWNQASGHVQSFNPDYWAYCVPYINIWHVFEMPFLGLMGYMPFGIYCAVWWILFAEIFHMPTQFHSEQKERDEEK